MMKIARSTKYYYKSTKLHKSRDRSVDSATG
jgi:hypothetical protein